MEIKVRCIDDEQSGYGNGAYKLTRNKIYTVKRITASYRKGRLHTPENVRTLFYELNEAPSLNFDISRFELVGKIIIDLPDDIYNLPVI